MFPDLIDLGFLHLKTYGACMAVGFLVCWTLIEKLSSRKDLGNLVLAMMVSGVVGSRIAYVIEHWQSEFAANPWSIIRVDQGGLMFYGGLILAMIVFVVWCRLYKENLKELAMLFITAVPLGHAFGRIGCFFYGCCYGRDSDAWCAVTFPAGSPSWYEHGRTLVSVLPTQLFEAAALLVLFALLMYLYRKFRDYTFSAYLVGYAIIRFFIEYLRGDPRAAVGPFSISQTISILMIILGAVTFELARHNRRG
ncbi:MAG: prolipoprotein diacylglyceryl transferase [Kiritimatiellae bacterium]|nr:prolipoprotein diacylglyceryl transferase [Kiritimatiellia bacterium]